ncbi:MAG: DUF192 domain-containing protein [Chloroflexota bacterium]|nr:DUF192 domain-containing protein [Chloroflexota bacterium]
MIRRSFATVIICALIFPVTLLAKPAVPVWRDAHPWSTEMATVVVDGIEIEAEIADTSPLQTRGLGYRDGLEPGTGMIFLFDSQSPRSFWMKGMRFCLDIIWIQDGEIVGAAENACPEPGVPDADLTRYRSGVPVETVLEVPAGWMAEHDVGAGANVTIILPGDPAG